MYIGQGYEWATHQPLIKTVLNLYSPQFVLELGPGVYSTSLFLENGVRLMCIENDPEWIDFLSDKFDLKVIHHDLGDMIEVHEKDLTQKQRKEITSFYNKLLIPDIKPNLLFVDQSCSSRVISINILKDKFDFIIYHDHDKDGFRVNSYDKIDFEGFNSYILETDRTGACMMIRNNLDKGFAKSCEVIGKYIESFKTIYKDCENIQLVEYHQRQDYDD